MVLARLGLIVNCVALMHHVDVMHCAVAGEQLGASQPNLDGGYAHSKRHGADVWHLRLLTFRYAASGCVAGALARMVVRGLISEAVMAGCASLAWWEPIWCCCAENAGNWCYCDGELLTFLLPASELFILQEGNTYVRTYVHTGRVPVGRSTGTLLRTY